MHLTVHRPEDPGEQPEQRGLTGTVAPPYDDDLTGLDADGHAPQHPDPASAVPEANLVQAHGAYHAIRHRRREPGISRVPAPVAALVGLRLGVVAREGAGDVGVDRDAPAHRRGHEDL